MYTLYSFCCTTVFCCQPPAGMISHTNGFKRESTQRFRIWCFAAFHVYRSFSVTKNNDEKEDFRTNSLSKQLFPELANTDAATMQSPPGETKDYQEHQVKLRTRKGTLQEKVPSRRENGRDEAKHTLPTYGSYDYITIVAKRNHGYRSLKLTYPPLGSWENHSLKFAKR